MSRTNLIECFNHTYNFSNSPFLREATEKAILSNKVYKESTIAQHRPAGNVESEEEKEDKPISIQNLYTPLYEDEEPWDSEKEYPSNVRVYEGTTFNWARKYVSEGRVAVLNFANPVNPGGGVANGAMAQEECLCRSSNLYACLKAENIQEEYYEYHKRMQGYFFSDRLIYTRDVTVFKSDDDVPVLLPEEQWFQVDVITCAAPYIAKRKHTNKAALKELFKSRIKNIFEAALDNGVEVLILGAFGCGAFKNPPELVAAAFHEVILENEYQYLFKEIVFAIKSTNNNAPWEACPNIVAFELEFMGISSELCKERMSGGVPIAYAYGDVTMPGGRVLKAGPEFLKYYEWQKRNPYKDKQFSILGDSISTLEGFNPRGYKIFYGGDNCEKFGVKEVNDTWWGKVINYFGGELLVNNSWSGSRVTKLPGSEKLFPSGCSDERTSSLHINGINPDVILVYLGTNDWAFGAKTGNETRVLDEDDNELFLWAYENMLKKLKSNYPKSEILCCTLSETIISSRPNFSFPHSYAGTHIEEYNEIIREVARKQACKSIDLSARKTPYDSLDGTHPTREGMDTIAEMVIRGMLKAGDECFLKCETGHHSYVRVEEHTGYTEYKCAKCGNIWWDSSFSLPKPECPEDEHEYEMIGQDGHGDYYICTKCGKEKDVWLGELLVAEDDELVDTLIGENYRITSLLALGRFTKIYLAKDEGLDIYCCIKVYDKWSEFHSREVYDKLKYEIKIQKSLIHPAIPVIACVIEDERYLYCVREYIEGVTLQSLVEKKGAQCVESVVSWALQLCDVLQYLHTLNPPQIYQDMKPRNIVLGNDGKIKIIDFEVMCVADDKLRRDTVVLGTRGYAAPEQLGWAQIDARTDIFGLGMTIHHLLTGMAPYEFPYECKPIRQENSNLPKQLERIVSKCIEKNPQKRYQNCLELRRDLEKLQKGMGFWNKIRRKK